MGAWLARAVALTVLSLGLFGCAEAGSPPAGGVALKEGGELAAWSPDGRLIAAPGSGEINLIGAGGSVLRKIPVPGVQHPIWPCECRLGWSGDGRHILFLTRRGRGGDPASVGSIDRASGRVRRKPLGVPAGDAAWSPQGWPLVFVVNSGAYEFNTPHRGPRPNLWRLDSLGSQAHPILRQPGTELRPAFSPDGTKLEYIRKLKGSRNVWVVDADGSNPHPVATGFVLASAAWSPDSKRLAVAGFSASEHSDRLYVASAAGGRPKSVPGVSNPSGALAWTPDGRWMTYATSDGTIWCIRPDGTDRQKLGEVPDHQIRRLLWSPDGRHLAYTAYRREESD